MKIKGNRKKLIGIIRPLITSRMFKAVLKLLPTLASLICCSLPFNLPSNLATEIPRKCGFEVFELSSLGYPKTIPGDNTFVSIHPYLNAGIFTVN